MRVHVFGVEEYKSDGKTETERERERENGEKGECRVLSERMKHHTH